MTVKCAGTTRDSVAATWAGFTTGISNFITIKGDRDQSDGFYSGTLQYSNSRYRMELSANQVLIIDQQYTVVDGIQIQNTDTGNTSYAIQLSADGDDVYTIKNNRLVNEDTGSTFKLGIFQNANIGAGNTIEIFNNIFAGFEGTNSAGVHTSVGSAFTGTTNIVNNTFYGCNVGIKMADDGTGATIISKNNCMFNNVDDHLNSAGGTFTITNCATEEGAGEGTNGQAITTPTDDMEDPENATPDSRDVRLKTTGVLEANGTTTGAPTTDIIGTARDGSTPDIGAWEIVAAGGGTILPQMIHHHGA